MDGTGDGSADGVRVSAFGGRPDAGRQLLVQLTHRAVRLDAHLGVQFARVRRVQSLHRVDAAGGRQAPHAAPHGALVQRIGVEEREGQLGRRFGIDPLEPVALGDSRVDEPRAELCALVLEPAGELRGCTDVEPLEERASIQLQRCRDVSYAQRVAPSAQIGVHPPTEPVALRLDATQAVPCPVKELAQVPAPDGVHTVGPEQEDHLVARHPLRPGRQVRDEPVQVTGDQEPAPSILAQVRAAEQPHGIRGHGAL
ncbi:MAG: hypothetical protein U5J97_10865 [Trueperaceae bacterium]|nr:hypothetical protein [Trueperaceae bacterium]